MHCNSHVHSRTRCVRACATVYLLQFATRANEVQNELRKENLQSTFEAIKPLSRCVPVAGGPPCVTFGYTSSLDANVVRVMDAIRTANNIPESEVKPFESADEVNNFLNSVCASM